MTTLEKFFLGFTWVLLVLGAILVRKDINEMLLLVLPLVVLSFLIVNWVGKGRTAARALAKGVVRIVRESDPTSALLVEREPPFPITKEDYANLQGALGKMVTWMASNQCKFPVVFYFRGYYRVLASKYEFENLMTELRTKYGKLL
jgi:hypothetical protein